MVVGCMGCVGKDEWDVWVCVGGCMGCEGVCGSVYVGEGVCGVRVGVATGSQLVVG